MPKAITIDQKVLSPPAAVINAQHLMAQRETVKTYNDVRDELLAALAPTEQETRAIDMALARTFIAGTVAASESVVGQLRNLGVPVALRLVDVDQQEEN
jgi:uncharacterized protein YhbP (UPF0306 family)